MSALSPCPFCGKGPEDELIEGMRPVGLHNYSGRMFVVQCENCGATGPQEDEPDKAIAGWNAGTAR